jgi:hypothetical protein
MKKKKKRELEHVTQKATSFASFMVDAPHSGQPNYDPPGTAYVHVAYAWTRREGLCRKLGTSSTFSSPTAPAVEFALPLTSLFPLLKTAPNQSTKLRLSRALTAAPAAYRICHRAVQISSQLSKSYLACRLRAFASLPSPLTYR